jgi:hypothetical protein
MDDKYTSRKFIVMCLQTVVLIILTIVYKKLDISNEITLMVLGASSGIAAVYTGFNVLQKKYDGAGPIS